MEFRNHRCLVQMLVVLSLLLAVPASATADCDPDCQGKVCGDDGCGGSCGPCPVGCVEGKCLEDCSMVPERGCCAGDVLVRCVTGVPLASDCGAMPSCGWNPSWGLLFGELGAYGCGTDGQSDPSGEFLMACVLDCAAACAGKECGSDGCGGICGQCFVGQVCDDGQCCTPQCQGKECGDDGCGGSCGDCPEGAGCSEGGLCCQGGCEGKECGPDGCGGSCGWCEEGVCIEGLCVTGCSSVPLKGCCYDGSVLKCLYGELIQFECQNGTVCGWKMSPGSYVCGNGATEDPSGQYPYGCVFDCSENCIDKDCGSDGCGGSCGSCGDGEVCHDGLCCIPDCTGKECGKDGCGGFCGSCPSDVQIHCEGGLCVPSYGCDETSYPGCVGCACEDCVCAAAPACCTVEWDYDCHWLCENECGGCVPCDGGDCTGKECGSDGCGGSCGECEEGFTCLDGACCPQQCDGMECGDDGCGGDCGPCPSGAVCTDDFVCEQMWGCAATETPGCGGCVCETCVCFDDPFCCEVIWDDWCVMECDYCGGCGEVICQPKCDNKECGWDGCGGSCGSCESGETCYQFQCCAPSCEGSCGGSNGCGGTCGESDCDLGSYCQDGECISTCADECEGAQCGYGRCGGPCSPGGLCPTVDVTGDQLQICHEGLCYADCGGISPIVGCCSEGRAYTCLCGNSGDCMLQVDDCLVPNPYPSTCGWYPEQWDPGHWSNPPYS